MTTIELNSLILPDNVISKMKSQQEESRKKKIEFGFALCKKIQGRILQIGNDCVGEERCVIRPEKKCKDGDSFIGLYHTHPHQTSDPSISDIKNHYKDGFGCIGAGTNNIITCCERKDEYNREIEMKINHIINTIQKPLRELPIGTQKRRDLYRELDKEIENIRREHFKCTLLNL